MSGHNKWSTIKYKKAATDAKRGKIFSKIAREITVAAKTGGGDASANITLRAFIQKARAANMPADNIERAVKKGTGEIDGAALEEMLYEGYAPGGVAMIVEVLTDNRNRTAADVRHAFTKFNASLAGRGSVARSFSRKGQILISAEGVDEDRLLELVLESGAEDMKNDEGVFEIITAPAQFMDVVDVLNNEGIAMEGSEIALIPESTIPVTDKGQASTLLRFIEALEDLEDVQNVYSNFDMADDLMQVIGEE